MVFFSFLAVGVAAVVISLKTNVWVSAACKEIKKQRGRVKRGKANEFNSFFVWTESEIDEQVSNKSR